MHLVTAPTLFTTLLTLSTTTSAIATPHGHGHAHVHTRSLNSLLTTRDAPPVSKRGLGYDYSSPASFDMWASTPISWCMNWLSASSNAGIACPSTYDYVPTLAGTTQNPNFVYWLSQWTSNANAAISAAKSAGKTASLLAFNEPDMTLDMGGCQMDVGDAVNAYQQYMTPLAGDGVALGSPSVTSSTQPGMGLDGWLKPFLAQCGPGCKIGFLQGHWYGCGSRDAGANCAPQDDINAFETWVNELVSMAAPYGGKVWIPEFQRYGDMPGQAQFLQGVDGGKGALAILDGIDAVERYAYFYDKEGLLISGGALSQVGQAYVS